MLARKCTPEDNHGQILRARKVSVFWMTHWMMARMTDPTG